MAAGYDSFGRLRTVVFDAADMDAEALFW